MSRQSYKPKTEQHTYDTIIASVHVYFISLQVTIKTNLLAELKHQAPN